MKQWKSSDAKDGKPPSSNANNSPSITPNSTVSSENTSATFFPPAAHHQPSANPHGSYQTISPLTGRDAVPGSAPIMIPPRHQFQPGGQASLAPQPGFPYPQQSVNYNADHHPSAEASISLLDTGPSHQSLHPQHHHHQQQQQQQNMQYPPAPVGQPYMGHPSSAPGYPLPLMVPDYNNLPAIPQQDGWDINSIPPNANSSYQPHVAAYPLQPPLENSSPGPHLSPTIAGRKSSTSSSSSGKKTRLTRRMSMSPPSDSNSGKPVTKRSRMGCLTCRQRKKRCCETRPKCTECNRLGLNCVWPKPGTEHKNKPKDVKNEENTINHEIYGKIKVLRGIVEYRSK